MKETRPSGYMPDVMAWEDSLSMVGDEPFYPPLM